jgi:hypothetical protein
MRTRNSDAKSKSPEKRMAIIRNAEHAKSLRFNKDFGLMVNLFRFDCMSALEDADTDEKRIKIGHQFAAISDLLTFIEKTIYLGKEAESYKEE